MSKAPNNIKLLNSLFTTGSQPVQVLEESVIGLGINRLKFKVILQEKDVVNNNRRTYSEQVLKEIVRQLAPKATERKLLAELDHPFTLTSDINEKLKRTSTIALDKACLLITDLSFDGKYIVATCETLTTPSGLLLYALIKDKVTFGFSLRALGKVNQRPDGVIEVLLQDLKAITFDVVANPSHSNALITEFLNESESISDTIRSLKVIRENVNETLLEGDVMYSLYNNQTPEILTECYFTGSTPKYISKDLGEEAVEVLMESSFIGGMESSPEKYCFGNTCVIGTIEETISYLMDVSNNNKIVGFKY